ncbi:rab3 GTPase-activating protein regulatory subunit [Sitophilus oryzae]|uniref:Rab3 GTPase-activating protein regulatory subunit n=1 Tax=Sitophilus oryzae TaxID=7048 RepID=A0A6J2XIR4_SITOR|nr:rab3 GTPase-activating protein regulatory subunit [Sitophilus oryzae]
MSCEIRLTASIQNISEVRRYLFPTDDERGTDYWLQKCNTSVSPTGDVIVIANEHRLVLLTSKWDTLKSLSTFQIIFSESIHESEKIRTVLCLPIVGLSHSSRVGPDWTCIAVGFDSGFVRFYTDNGHFLFEEQFHNEDIISIKCQSQHSPRPDICPELFIEEIYVHYQSNVCVINGQQLCNNLRECRAQLAKATSNSRRNQLSGLNIKKWGFEDQSTINDVAVVGLNMSNTFDHLLTASTCGGFDSKYRNAAPNSTLVLTAGSKPYLGYHYALEGVNQPVLSDVAKVVASKLKSALPTWLAGPKPSQEKEITAATQPTDDMALRFGLCDLRRTATEIVVSPNKKLAVVSDTLGRVILIDCFKGIAIKIFKGYREAQCAFLQVPDERRSKHRIGNKVANFLIIYSPKKGTLEIFTLQQGIKIAVFSASKYSKLMYISHGLLGFSNNSKSNYICQFNCVFMDNDGQIKEITVPFHYALAEKNSGKARDIYLYKKLRQFIKCGELDTEQLNNEIHNICTEIKSIEIKAQLVDLLISSKNLSYGIILNCVNYFLDNHADSENDNKSFKINWTNIKNLLELYSFVTTHEEACNDDETKQPRTPVLDSKELDNLQKLLDLAISSSENNFKKSRVTFSSDIGFTVSDFLNTFDISKADGSILKSNLEENHVFNASEVIFMKFISGERTDFENFKQAISSSGISVQNLFYLVIYYWVNRDLDIKQNLEKDMHNFSEIISVLLKTASKSIVVNHEDDTVSVFWQDIRQNLANSARPFPALMAAMLCKNVSLKWELENSEDNIEVLTQENILWSLLIGKLEDVATLNIIFSTKPVVIDSNYPVLKYDRVDISLKYILENGRGSVSELAAQWLCSSGCSSEMIVINEVIYKNLQNETSNESSVTDVSKDSNVENLEISEGMHLELIEKVKSNVLFKYLNLLKQQFPYSLEGSTLLANMCWEYALAWRKSMTSLDHLEAAIKCLNNILSLHIKRGLFLLVWNTHLKIVLESSCKLINKVGRLPKEKLCQQDTGLSDKQVVNFINICKNFLDIFLDVSLLNCDLPKPTLKFEAIWENGTHQTLTELAVQQKEVDYNLLHLHYQLSLVLHMISTFSIKFSKPVNNLFEASIGNLFFTDFQRTIDTNWNKTDIKINASRLQFLRKVITFSLETVTLNENNEIYCVEHVEWMQKCLSLARIWNLDIDTLKRFQIIQLYISGFDIIAQELIPAVNEVNDLGEELLKIAGRRMSQFLSSSPHLSENIAALSPVLSRFIKTLNGDWCSPSNLENIKNLTTETLQCLNSSNKEYYKLAELLLDACNTLIEINS